MTPDVISEVFAATFFRPESCGPELPYIISIAKKALALAIESPQIIDSAAPPKTSSESSDTSDSSDSSSEESSSESDEAKPPPKAATGKAPPALPRTVTAKKPVRAPSPSSSSSEEEESDEDEQEAK
eukprot:GHVT01096648.1.p1 GENE.GHVT01096648.1~~GHVT01096648.1.p1  ORF type:complete len:127 (+),score=31.14 GHVT01096648.1:1869-2249(+)